MSEKPEFTIKLYEGEEVVFFPSSCDFEDGTIQGKRNKPGGAYVFVKINQFYRLSTCTSQELKFGLEEIT